MSNDLYRNLPDLPRILMDLMSQVPRGRVTTFGDLAQGLGNPVAALWVARFLIQHDHAADCRCHRAVRSDGALGGYIVGDHDAKAIRLAGEGVVVAEGRVDLAGRRFQDFVSEQPLAALANVQDALHARLAPRSWVDVPAEVGGVDVSYPRPDEGVAAYALVETQSGRLVWSVTVRAPATFPYISSYLSFREIPLLLSLLDQVRAAGRLAEVVLVDGTGILHPRRMGIAAQAGVAAEVPTVGVAKKLLCGKVLEADVGQPAPVEHLDEHIGWAIPARPGARQPLYVSPGQATDVAFCRRIVERLLVGHKLPAPLYWADRISREEGRRKSGIHHGGTEARRREMERVKSPPP